MIEDWQSSQYYLSIISLLRGDDESTSLKPWRDGIKVSSNVENGLEIIQSFQGRWHILSEQNGVSKQTIVSNLQDNNPLLSCPPIALSSLLPIWSLSLFRRDPADICSFLVPVLVFSAFARCASRLATRVCSSLVRRLMSSTVRLIYLSLSLRPKEQGLSCAMCKIRVNL